jgi:hypothetical protein
MVKHVKAAVLNKVAFLHMTQYSLVKHISVIDFQGYIVSSYAMKSYREAKVQPHVFSALYGVEWLASRPDRFIPEDRNVSNILIGGWLRNVTGQDAKK